MFSRLFRKSKSNQITPVTSVDKLGETLRSLEKKETGLLRKVDGEVKKAKAFSAKKNKKAAIQCLRKKKLLEQQIEQLGNYQMRIYDQINMLENAETATETVGALKTGSIAMKAVQKETNIDDVDKTLNEISDQTQNMKQIQEALSNPIGLSEDFDEDELEAELEELEGLDLEEKLLQRVMPTPLTPAKDQARKQPSRPTPRIQADKEDELASLQALAI